MTVTTWLPGGACAMLHLVPPRGAGVVVVPPFGWEEQASYRLRRVWATQLAERGHPVLRLQLPGAGDSADPATGSELLSGWTEAVSAACEALRAESGCARVAVLGLGLGGVPAVLAAAGGAGDDIALWSTPTRGRAAVRELRAFARLHAAGQGEDPDVLRVSGFALPAATQAALSDVDLAQTLPSGAGRRALLLGRDGADPDAALADAWRARGTEVTVAPGRGWTDLVGHPMTSRLDDDVARTVRDWLWRADAPGSTAAAPRDGRSRHGTAAEVGAGVVERSARLPCPGGDAFAVVSERPGAVADRVLVLLNAGAVPHTGPNRMWVTAARQAAAAGVPAVRLDLPGIGEAPAEGEGTLVDADLYTPERSEQVRAALDGLVDQGLPPHFVLAGLCSGAYWAFDVAQDPRVEAVALLNPMALLWHQSLPGAALPPDLRRQVRWAAWRRLLTGQTSLRGSWGLLRALLRHAAAVPAARRARRTAGATRQQQDPLLLAVDRVGAAGTQIAIAFSTDEPLLRDLQRQGLLDELAQAPHVDLRLLGGPPDSHALAPLALQTSALQLIADLAWARPYGAAERSG